MAEHLGPAAVLLLERWDLLEQVVATGCPPADRTTVWVGADRFDLPNPAEVPLTYAPRRAALVTVTSAAAAAAGAEVRSPFVAKELVWEGGRVAGVVGHAADGHSVYERAHVVVGADGRRSVIAQIVGAETYDERPATNCCYYAYWRAAAGECPEVFLRGRRAVAVYPTDGGVSWVVVARPVTDWAAFKRAPERVYREQLGLFPRLAPRFRTATRESRFGGTADLGRAFRSPWGPGWALVGDAAQPGDTSICLGASDVFVQAQMMANAIDEGLSGHRTLDDALSDYHRWRDASAREVYETSCALASYEWSLADVGEIVDRAQAARLRQLEGLVTGCWDGVAGYREVHRIGTRGSGA